jgi:hypothetical protein
MCTLITTPLKRLRELSYKSCPATAMQATRTREGIARTHSLPRHLMDVSDQPQAPAAIYTTGKDPGTHWTGGWEDLRG